MIGIGCFRMIIDYDETVGHNRGHPTGLGHEEKMDVIACLLDEGKKRYVNEEHTAWISANPCRVGEMVTLDESSTMEHTIVKKPRKEIWHLDIFWLKFRFAHPDIH